MPDLAIMNGLFQLDESDGSFLELTPTHGVVTNIEHEHIDFIQQR